MESTINSGIHLVSTFPMSSQNPEFVMVVASHFDPISRSVKETSGKKIIKFDEDFFDTIFKCPNIDKYFDITMQLAQTYYDRNLEKCRKNMNDNWLKNPSYTVARWPKTFLKNDLIEEVNDLVTLLSRVKGLPTSNTYYEWMY